MPFSGCSFPSLCRLSNVVILASRPRLPTPRWRDLGVRVFPVIRVILLPYRAEDSRMSVTVGGEFPLRALSVARRGPSSTMAPLPSVLALDIASRLSQRCGSVVRVFSSTRLPGFTGPESSVLPVDLPSSAPFPLRDRRYRVCFLRPLPAAGQEDFPGEDTLPLRIPSRFSARRLLRSDIGVRSVTPAHPPPDTHLAGSLFATDTGSASGFLQTCPFWTCPCHFLAFPFRPITVGFRFTSFLFSASVSCPAHDGNPGIHAGENVHRFISESDRSFSAHD
jgi:hypothetical protein